MMARWDPAIAGSGSAGRRPSGPSPADRDEVQASLICYGRAVVHDEWPRMRDGQESARAARWLGRMDATVRAATLTTDKEIAALGNGFTQNEQRQEGRRGRRCAELRPPLPDTTRSGDVAAPPAPSPDPGPAPGEAQYLYL